MKTSRLLALAFGVLILTPLAASAQKNAKVGPCPDEDRGGWRDNDRESYCESREFTLPVGQLLRVDGRTNGGVRVEGWDRNEIRVIASVKAWRRTEERAREDVREIEILTDNNELRAEGPDEVGSGSWSVSYHVMVPRKMNMALRTRNGGLKVDGVSGKMELRTLNGGIALWGVGGDVYARASNGGLDVRLAGDRWEGEGLDAETANGGVDLSIPANYSARLETGTVNGRLWTDFPITVRGSLSREISADLGKGGATVHVMTTNGGVRIREGR